MILIAFNIFSGVPVLVETVSSSINIDTYNTYNKLVYAKNNFGGNIEDYSIIFVKESTDNKKVFTHEFEVLDNLIIFGNERVHRTPVTPPTREEYMLDLDYRLSVIELGL